MKTEKLTDAVLFSRAAGHTESFRRYWVELRRRGWSAADIGAQIMVHRGKATPEAALAKFIEGKQLSMQPRGLKPRPPMDSTGRPARKGKFQL